MNKIYEALTFGNYLQLVMYVKVFIFLWFQNKMNGVWGHLCAHNYRLNWARETSWAGEMNEMTLPSRHRIWGQGQPPGGLSPILLPLGHRGSAKYWFFTSDQGGNILFLWNLNARAGLNQRTSIFQAGSFNLCTMAHALHSISTHTKWFVMLHIGNVSNMTNKSLRQ